MIVVSVLFLSIFVLFGISIFCSIHAQGSSWNVYENTFLGYKISYPSEWVYVETNQRPDTNFGMNGVVFTPVNEMNFKDMGKTPNALIGVGKIITPVKNLPLSFFYKHVKIYDLTNHRK